MWLQVMSGPEAGRQLRIDGVLLIGRDPGSDLMLPDGNASRRHAMLSAEPDGRIVLHDLRSANGTYVDGHRIDGSVILTGSEQLRIGETILQLTIVGARGTAAIEPDPRSGQTLGGRYRIEGLIAEG